MTKSQFQEKLESILKSNFVYSKTRQKIIEQALEVFTSFFKKPAEKKTPEEIEREETLKEIPF